MGKNRCSGLLASAVFPTRFQDGPKHLPNRLQALPRALPHHPHMPQDPKTHPGLSKTPSKGDGGAQDHPKTISRCPKMPPRRHLTLRSPHQATQDPSGTARRAARQPFECVPGAFRECSGTSRKSSGPERPKGTPKRSQDFRGCPPKCPQALLRSPRKLPGCLSDWGARWSLHWILQALTLVKA